MKSILLLAIAACLPMTVQAVPFVWMPSAPAPAPTRSPAAPPPAPTTPAPVVAQPFARWAKPIDVASLSKAAIGSKALACLDRRGALRLVEPKLPGDVLGAIYEARAARAPKQAGDAILSAMYVNGDAGRRIFARDRKSNSEVAEWTSVFEGKLPSPLPSYLPYPLSLGALVRVGRFDDARAVYEHFDATGHLALDEAVHTLGALGRADEVYAKIRPEQVGRRVVLESELIEGILDSASRRGLVAAVTALVHDARDHSDDVFQLGLVATKMRVAGYGDQARPLRTHIFETIEREHNYAVIHVGLGPEVLAAGDQTELDRLDKLNDQAGSSRTTTLSWERAYYRGDFASAFAEIRRDADPEDRDGHLYMLWARAAAEGFDPAALRSIDQAACAR